MPSKNYGEFGTSGKRLFVRSQCPGCTYGPVHANRCDRRNRPGGRQYPRGRSFILVTCYAQRGGRPARTRQGRHASVQSRVPSPARRACPPTVACSKVAHTNIYDEFSTRGERFFLQSCPACICGPVLAYRGVRMNRVGAPKYPRARSLVLDTSNPAERLTGGGENDRHRGARSRISSPVWDACLPTVVCSKVPHVNIYDEFGANAKRFFV